jgi:hypothetical protein
VEYTVTGDCNYAILSRLFTTACGTLMQESIHTLLTLPHAGVGISNYQFLSGNIEQLMPENRFTYVGIPN